MKVVGGDDIVRALEQVLRQNLPIVLEALELTHLGEVKTWQIVPTMEALASAKHPSIALVSPSMTAAPQRSGAGGRQYTGEWRMSIGVFDRGDNHEGTQTGIQQWAKAIRVAALLTPLTGTGISLRWAGEEYDVIPTKQDSRTIAGAEVMFDATVDVALDLTDIPAAPPLRSVLPDVQPH